MRQISEIIVHSSATKPEWMHDRPTSEKVEEIRRWHTSAPRNWRDIGYHVVIDRDGTIADGRPIAQAGAHVRGRNANSIGICLIGGHGSDANDPPSEHFTAAQLAALRHQIDRLKLNYPGITKVSGHNEYAAKACPGFKVGPWLEKKPQRDKPTQSTTVQASGVQIVTAGGGAVSAIAALDGTAQIVALAICGVVALAAMWIMRERINKFMAGWRS